MEGEHTTNLISWLPRQTRGYHIAISYIVFLCAQSTFSLECWHNQDCPDGERFCLRQCQSEGQVCTGTFQSNGMGVVIPQYYGCFTSQSCDNTRCEYHIVDATGVHTCCCDSSGCNAPGDLIADSTYTAPTLPSPSGTLPTPIQNHITCEIYSDSGGVRVHRYESCRGMCGATLRLNSRMNYVLDTLFCRESSSVTNTSSQCVLDSSGNRSSVECICKEPLCNAVKSLNFTRESSVELNIDQECADLECTHECLRRASDGSGVCVCQQGYILNADGRTCVDLDECSRNEDSCSHDCINTDGSYQCGCPMTMFLVDGNTCQNSSLLCNKLSCTADSVCQPEAVEHCDRPVVNGIKTDACQATYQLINNQLVPRFSGCIQRDSTCIEGNQCILLSHSSSSLPDFAVCCCTGSECNFLKNIIFPIATPPTTTTMATTSQSDSTTGSTLPIDPTDPTDPQALTIGISVIAMVAVVGIVFVLVAVVIVYCRYKRLRSGSPLLPLHEIPGNSNIFAGDSVRYEYKNKIGNGRFSDVYRGEGPRALSYAVKVFKFDAKDSWLKECEVYKVLGHHPNTLHYIGKRETPEMWIITEFHAKGSLSRLLAKDILNFEEFINLATSLANGLVYLHSAIGSKPQIAHRDIKSSNIIISERMECIISDFGLAITLPLGELKDSSGIGQVGTPRYMAPEIIEGTINSSKELSLLQGDTYSSGLVYWELSTRTCLPHMSLDQIPPYRAPYDEFLDGLPTVTIEKMAEIFTSPERKRPTIPSCFKIKPEYDSIVNTIEESWCSDENSRISSTCVWERFSAYREDDSGVSTYSQPPKSSSTTPSPPLPPFSTFPTASINETTV